MSFKSRLSRIVRSNVNSLFDRLGPDGDTSSTAAREIEKLSDEELERELERRKERREAAQRGAAQGEQRARARGGDWPRARGERGEYVARLYAQLECEVGADLETVRISYRQLMRRYHPDVHQGDPERQRVATELSQRLTQAYNELTQHLKETRS